MDYKKIANDVFEIEIQGLQEVQKKINQEFEKAIELILASTGKVIVTGMGKSGIIGKKISATLASTGTPSFFLHPGEAYHGDLGMVEEDDTILAISYSGETDELIKLLSFFKDNKNKIIGVAGNENSTLAKHSHIFLNIGVSKEACPWELAPTTSTTATLALGDALAMVLMSAREFKPENFARFHPGGSLGRKLLVRVKDVMRSHDLPTVKLDDSFETIISRISEGRLGISVVVDEKNQVLGVITDGDIRRLIQKEKANVISLKAESFYTKNPRVIEADEKIIVAEKMMQDLKITTLLVTEGKSLKGVLHRYDI